MKNRKRFVYAAAFAVLLLAEILIALFVHDRFVRPYIGDLLVTVLLCCLCRVVLPVGSPLLPVWVFAFAALVEVGQYFDLVKLLGLEEHRFLSTLLGRTFSVWDLVCYGAGCAAFFVAETLLHKKTREVET